MNEIHKSYLERIASDDVFLEAVKHFILRDIDLRDQEVTPDMTNEVVGQNYKALLTAKELIKDSFNNLAQFKKSVSEKNNFNKER